MGALKQILHKIYNVIYLIILKFIWRRNNKHNYTTMKNYFNMASVEVGKATYGDLTVINYSNSQKLKLKIGNFCSIAGNVTFILAGEHRMNTISTYPFITKIIDSKKSEAGGKGDIIIGDDVWIGHGTIVLSGVNIGQGAIIAAGSIVNKDVPAYAVVGGVPAKVIKYRFQKEIIDKLIKVDFNKLDTNMIIKNQTMLYEEITSENVDRIIDSLELK